MDNQQNQEPKEELQQRQEVQQPDTSQSSAGQTPPQGGSAHKGLAIVGYIIPILFFLPMVSDAKNDEFAMFHANQQLVLLLVWVVGWFLSFFLIGFLVFIFAFILMIIGIVHAANGDMKKLPLVGGITILK